MRLRLQSNPTARQDVCVCACKKRGLCTFVYASCLCDRGWMACVLGRRGCAVREVSGGTGSSLAIIEWRVKLKHMDYRILLSSLVGDPWDFM